MAVVVYTYSVRLVSVSERPYTLRDLVVISSKVSRGGVSVDGGMQVLNKDSWILIGSRNYSISLAELIFYGCRGITVPLGSFNHTLAPWGNGTHCGLASRITISRTGWMIRVDYYTANFTGYALCIEASTSKVVLDVWADRVLTPWQVVEIGAPVRIILINHLLNRC